MWSFFGYENIKDEYKVVRLVWELSQEQKVVRSEHQVLVLGPDSSWRRITQSVVPHHPYSQGIYIDCVLYYGAWAGAGESTRYVVISFDVRSEELKLIELPVDAGIIWDTSATNLMNYGGKLTVFDYSRFSNKGSVVILWVLQDARKSQWSNRKTFVLSLYNIRLLFEDEELLIQGTSREGEIRFFSKTYSANSQHYIYHLDRGNFIEGVVVGRLHPISFEIESLHMNYWDDFESIMYLEAFKSHILKQ